MEFTFTIFTKYNNKYSHILKTTQPALDLDDAIEEATKILEVFKKSAKVVFMIEHDGKDVAGISPEVEDWVKL